VSATGRVSRQRRLSRRLSAHTVAWALRPELLDAIPVPHRLVMKRWTSRRPHQPQRLPPPTPGDLCCA